MLIHNGQKPHNCTQCDYASSRAHDLRDHIKTHSWQKPKLCKRCEYSTIPSSSLTKLVLTHSGEEPHHCKECGSSFSQAQHLKTHLRIHTREKPFKCPQCSYSSDLKNTWPGIQKWLNLGCHLVRTNIFTIECLSRFMNNGANTLFRN